MLRDRIRAFECGFDPCMSRRVPFSLRFFLLAIIFLIFDVEVVLLLPALFVCHGVGTAAGFVGFVLILGGGLIYEWREGSLEWV